MSTDIAELPRWIVIATHPLLGGCAVIVSLGGAIASLYVKDYAMLAATAPAFPVFTGLFLIQRFLRRHMTAQRTRPSRS